jgi:signal transduction histidine kinase
VKRVEIQSSRIGELSDSIALTKSFLKNCKSDNTSKSTIVDRGNIRRGHGHVLVFRKGGLGLRNEPQRQAQGHPTEAERMSTIGRMACSISHDLRHSLTAIYANAEFLECPDICASMRADLLLEIQEAVLAMTERIDSLL